MAGEIMGGGLAITLIGYGKLYVPHKILYRIEPGFKIHRWKKLRRAAHDGFKVSSLYEPIQEREASSLVKSLIEEPELWDDHFKRRVLF